MTNFSLNPWSAILKAWDKIKKFFKWSKHRISHKLEHLRISNLIDIIVEHGLALAIIIVVWEIIEDVKRRIEGYDTQI